MRKLFRLEREKAKAKTEENRTCLLYRKTIFFSRGEGGGGRRVGSEVFSYAEKKVTLKDATLKTKG